MNHEQLILQISRSCKCNNSGTLRQFGPVFSKKRAKIKIQEQFSMRITSQTSLLINMSRDVSPTRIWKFGFLITLESLSFFSLKSSLEFTLHCGKYTSLSASPPIFWSKFQLCTNNFHDNFLVNCTIVFVFFFLNPAAKIVLNMLFNTCFKITPHNTQWYEWQKLAN